MVSRRQMKRALFAGAMLGGSLTSSAAAAHHGPATSAIEPTAGLLPQAGATAVPRSRLSVVTRYAKLPDRLPSYTMPIARSGDHVGLLELGYTHAFCDYATMSVALPLLLRSPDDAPDERPKVGLGDLRLGSRIYPWWSPSSSFSLALDLSMPTAGRNIDDEGIAFGTGDFIPRGSWLLTQRWGREGWARFGVSVEGGASGALRPDGNVVLDHGLTGSWTPFEVFGLYVGLRTRTFLRDDEAGLAALRSFPRAAGDTLVTMSPGLRFFPVPEVILTAGAQLPVTTARDDEGSFTLRLDVLL